ncbi:hypothetical protein N7468_002250 [Penicillium chermesinum]|uniref:Sulfhydryl oxidase n=1 Tax=Penicillium chermesinum TaxID=63820 RepID=A0A9W9TXT4_9EURO|nr:uncharacterized protein N7468_002250 [Penicillium chermesinum]KAJ5247267.1 hypothetical protein N7468_002250 [Penicillium chermesinum]
MANRQIARRIVVSGALSICLLFFLFIRPQGPPSPAVRAPGHIVHPSTNAPGIVIQDDLLKGAVVMPRLGNETVKAELGRATWKYFHTVMARFPEKPTTDEQDALRSYIYLFARLYPCGECAEHFQQHLNKYPPQVSSRKAAAGWACFIHNEVNVMLDKPEFDCNDLGAFYDCGCAGDEDEAGAEDGTHPATSRAAGKSDEPDPLDHLAVEISKEAHRRYVTLKMFINSASLGKQLDDELNIYRRIEGASQNHPGREYVRSLLDSFDVDGPEEKHRCLVHPPLWENIKADNLMFGIDDDSVFSDFEENELRDPSPGKELDGRTIYVSRELRMPKRLDAPVLCDFGSAVFGDEKHTEDVQPDIYRAPEVILEAPWTYSVDIWNVGCMIWDLFEGGSLFSGRDPEFQTYRSRAHLAEMISLLGPPPPSLLAQGDLTGKFFKEGNFCAGIPVPEYTPLEARETTLEGEEKEKFLCLVRKMLQWEPGKRSSARELEEDDWVQTGLRG